MPARSRHTRPDILPVVLGGDIGAYALARELHEATGQRVTLLSSSPIDAITLSCYIDVIQQETKDEPALLTTLRTLVAGREPRSAVVMGNSDALASFLARHREQLEPQYVVPFPSIEAMETLSDKESFARACAQHGLRTPRQVVIHGDDLTDGDPAIDLPFPLIGKPAIGSYWDGLSFEGKRKIYEIDTAEDMAALWTDLRHAGFSSTFLIQERIPGEDEAMRSITAYVASDGTMTMVGSARVLLEDHSPTLIGNPVAMITEAYPHLWDGVEALLTDAGYRGFANFDIKVDPRSGEAVFFEVNPRIGRNSYYMAAAGINPMIPMIRDLIDRDPGPRREAHRRVLYHLVPLHLILHQVEDPHLCRAVMRLALRAVDPLCDPEERSWRRRLIITAQKLNHDRKFHRYRPKRLLRSRTTSS